VATVVDWDNRYREGFYSGNLEPHPFLKRFCAALPRGGRVADIAMGNGRDLLFLASQGFDCYGLERSWEALKIAREDASRRNLPLNIVMGDAGWLPFREASFDGLLVFYFLERSILANLVTLLRPGGLLIYETFLKRQNSIDRPRNPDYLLDDAELVGRFPGIELLFYEEGIFRFDGKQRALARLAGRKG
jgi:tellurite methyltransferase